MHEKRQITLNSSALQFIGIHAAHSLPKATVLRRLVWLDAVKEFVRLRPEAQNARNLPGLRLVQWIFAQPVILRLEACDGLYLSQNARRDDKAALHPLGCAIVADDA